MDTVSPQSWNDGVPFRNEQGAFAAGSNAYFAVPNRVNLELVSVKISFTADANAANRIIRLVLGNTVDEDVVIQYPVNVVANETVRITWCQGAVQTTPSPFNERVLLPLPHRLRLTGLERARLITQNIQVGDVFNHMIVRGYKWMYPIIPS